MRLVERGKVDLDSPVRRYIPDFAVADESASATVTVRQLLNHTAGWDGCNGQDFGRGDDAVALYVKAMTRLPQLTPPGTAFAYNNSGLVVAGRIIELVAGTTYESTVQRLLLDPLQLAHTRYFSDQIIGLNVAASHSVVDGKPIAVTDFWTFPRSCNPTGGLMSTARDQLRYAQFHLGDGRAPNGEQILSRQSLKAMRSNPGAGGTLWVELTGMGVTWMLRPSAENVTIVEHGGTWKGQRSGFVMVPDRNFAMTVLTNSDGGFHMINDLFASDWALQRFAGLSNLPATPQRPWCRRPGALRGPVHRQASRPKWRPRDNGHRLPGQGRPACWKHEHRRCQPGWPKQRQSGPRLLSARLWARPWTRQQAHRQSLQLRARAGRQHRLVL